MLVCTDGGRELQVGWPHRHDASATEDSVMAAGAIHCHEGTYFRQAQFIGANGPPRRLFVLWLFCIVAGGPTRTSGTRAYNGLCCKATIDRDDYLVRERCCS
jgi:hypothetical protein